MVANFVFYLSAIGSVFLILFGILFLIDSLQSLPGWFELFLGLAMGWAAVSVRLGYKVDYSSRFLMVVLIPILTYLFFYGGYRHTGIFWYLTFPAFAFFLLPLKEAIRWVFTFLIFLLFTLATMLYAGLQPFYPLYTQFMAVVVYLIITLMTYFYVRRNELKDAELMAALTEKLNVQQALSETSRLFESIFTHATDGIWIIDRNRITVNANQAMCRMLGLPLEKVVGRDIYNFVDQKGVATFKKMTNLSQEHGRGQHYEIELMQPDGRIVVCEFSTAPLADESGERIGSFAIVRDLSEKKSIENEIRKKSEELQAVNESLGVRVQSEIEERRKKEQLLIQQSRLAAMGEMIGSIAHQWRQPLNSLGLLIQDIADADAHGELTKEYINSVIEQSMGQIKYMSKTIDDFRNFFKPSREKEVFSLPVNLMDSVNMVQYQLRGQGMEVKFDIAEYNINVVGYPNELKQVFINIFMNSRDAIIEQRKQSGRDFAGVIEAAIRRVDDGYDLSIADNGCGLAPDVMERIFDPYFTTKSPERGTGIGLYMARVIIESNMGWQIRAANRLSQAGAVEGAKIDIHIPAKCIVTDNQQMQYS